MQWDFSEGKALFVKVLLFFSSFQFTVNYKYLKLEPNANPNQRIKDEDELL